MKFQSTTYSSSHIKIKPPITKHLFLSSPIPHLKLNQQAIVRFQNPLNLHLSQIPTRHFTHKLGCVSPCQELVIEDQEPKSDENGPEIVEPTSGGLETDRSIWEQMVEIIKFSGPATGLWICGPLMSLIDTAVIGQGSSIELAALGPGTVLCDYASYVFMFLSIATSNMVATSLAQQGENQVQHQISILLFVGLACGVLMLFLTKCFSAWALIAFVGEKNMHLVPASNSYVQIRALAWPAILVGWVAQSASLGMKDSMGPLKALVIASAINGIGDIVLCTFLGFGIAGAAWATAASQVIAAYAMVDALNRNGYSGFSLLIPSLSELQEIFEIAAPVFIIMVSKVTFYALMIYFATSMGTHIVAAHQVVGQIFGICSVWGEPLSQTAQSFMPELLYGVNRSLVKAWALLKSLLIIGASVGLVLGIAATSVPWLVPNLFTPDPAVIGEMLKVSIPFFLALSVTPCILSCEGTLLAGRDLKFLSSSMSGCFALGALALLIARSRGLGLVGCWSALAGFQWARFLVSFGRLLSPSGVLYSEDLDHFRLPKLKAA